MQIEKIKKLLVFALSLILAGFLVWFGFKFLFLPSDLFTPTQIFIVGILVILGGISAVSSFDLKNRWTIGSVLIATGFYLFARSAGIIDIPWLARTLGALCWVAAGLVIYMAFPGMKAFSK